MLRRKKLKQGRGIGSFGYKCFKVLDNVHLEGFNERSIFDHKLSGTVRANYMSIWRKSTPVKRNAQCKDPGMFDE